MMDLNGKTAVITGAAGGIGLAIVERLLMQGMNVVLSDIDEARLAAQVERLKNNGHIVSGCVTDVSSQESVNKLAQFALSTYGNVHIVCNNAGIGGGSADDKPVWEASISDWKWALDINVWGIIHGIRSFVPLLLKQGHECHIINTASRAGLISGTSIYGTTKHAVISITEALYVQLKLAESCIHVSLLCPGAVNTELSKNSSRIRPRDTNDSKSYKDSSKLSNSNKLNFMDSYRNTVETRMASGSSAQDMADLLLNGLSNGDFYIMPGSVKGGPIQARFNNIEAHKILDAKLTFPQFEWNETN